MSRWHKYLLVTQQGWFLIFSKLASSVTNNSSSQTSHVSICYIFQPGLKCLKRYLPFGNLMFSCLALLQMLHNLMQLACIRLGSKVVCLEKMISFTFHVVHCPLMFSMYGVSKLYGNNLFVHKVSDMLINNNLSKALFAEWLPSQP